MTTEFEIKNPRPTNEADLAEWEVDYAIALSEAAVKESKDRADKKEADLAEWEVEYAMKLAENANA